jgi:Tfp pilus assembly protein PilF
MLPRAERILFLLLAIALGTIFGAIGTRLLYIQYEHRQAMANFHLAMQYQNEGKVDEALALLYQAIAKDTDFYGSFLQLGDLYTLQEKHDQAAKMYKEALDRLGSSGNKYSDSLSQSGLKHDAAVILQKLTRSSDLARSQRNGPSK